MPLSCRATQARCRIRTTVVTYCVYEFFLVFEYEIPTLLPTQGQLACNFHSLLARGNSRSNRLRFFSQWAAQVKRQLKRNL